jgi:hypothetical protein
MKLDAFFFMALEEGEEVLCLRGSARESLKQDYR